MRNPKLYLKNDQRGMASIIVAVTLMLIISLIVLAMSQNTQNEQRQALDRQLSDQAFYNAETGINDVAAYLYANPNADADRTDCTGDLNSQPVPNQIGDSGDNSYTCILYDKAPKSLQYDNISTSSPKVIPIQTINQTDQPTNIKNLNISWDDSQNRDGDIDGKCSFSSGSPDLPELCSYGGVRVEIIRPQPTREAMRQSSLIAFLLPNEGSGSPVQDNALYPNNQGTIAASDCSNRDDTSKRRCTNAISGINTNNLYLSIRSLYRPVNVTITGTDDLGNELRFKDTQIVVDSTGKAADVLRRVQVRIPAKAQYSYPGFALQTKDSICKVLNVRLTDSGAGEAQTADSGKCPID